jgi:two-component system C4-dicarboxylate transport response regulator DctD
VADFEKSVISGALLTHKGSLKAVYQSLGISRKTLYDKMRRYGLDKNLPALDLPPQ